ncbi:Flp family type IVb pilin [Salmonella enterica]|uniref:Flp family type IVb pilin n=2 Tax=Salmonella enterica TaxID=28901 RepID=A0A723CBR1_SALER|nr:Flp family type IVb pilin [Salmonella enterica]EDT6405373.1 Flp family type IVb pilin [Salmonella enterica subsp. enterica]HBN1189103.1 Flp family type IVb pilin [Salmonella enterica subsp. enterica serovar Schwarzengrund]EDW1263019.1 Flp family type IVb pilin [Salmonella enterica subsp. enterica]EGI5220224.1 Flp family type IVb pilin [Salmonella enterica subsp. enterica serovar Albany]ELX2344724.1 Flp family type IVb pilin [Salmonella enterica]
MSENLMLKGYVTGRIIAESICNKCKKYIRTDDGVTAVEYAIVVAGVAAIVITIFGTGGPVEDVLNTTFTNLKSKITSTIGGGGTPSP